MFIHSRVGCCFPAGVGLEAWIGLANVFWRGALEGIMICTQVNSVLHVHFAASILRGVGVVEVGTGTISFPWRLGKVFPKQFGAALGLAMKEFYAAYFFHQGHLRYSYTGGLTSIL